MLLAVLACPCVTLTVEHKLEEQHLLSSGSTRPFIMPIIFGPPVVALIALLRIRSAKGGLKGREFVYFSFAFSALSLGLMVFLYYALRDVRFGPAD
jgi:hypothetical protein